MLPYSVLSMLTTKPKLPTKHLSVILIRVSLSSPKNQTRVTGMHVRLIKSVARSTLGARLKVAPMGNVSLPPPTGAPTGDTSIGSRLVNFMAKEIALANAKADEDSLEDKQEHLLVNKEDVSKNLRGAADALFPFYDEEGGGEDSEVGCKEEGAKGCGPFNKCCDGNYCMPVPFMGNYCQKKWGEEGGVLFTI